MTMPDPHSAFAAGWHHHLWLAGLVAASIVCSLGLACAVPFAGLGVIAALTLPRRDALRLAVALWLVNQIIGFTWLHYPTDPTTLIWGGVLGVVALASTAAAQTAARGRSLPLASVAAFAAAFIVYEGGLYLVSAVWLGGTGVFTAAIVLRILAINAASFAVLLAASLLLAAARPRRAAPAAVLGAER